MMITINELATTVAGLLKFKLDSGPHEGAARRRSIWPTAPRTRRRKLLGYSPACESGRRSPQHDRLDPDPRACGLSATHLDIEILNESTPETWRKRLF